MWLTLPPMKNYWHEPTCQQYNHEWCAEEKGHSWGPRHYVEEQLSSLLTTLRCSIEDPASLICTFICFFFFNYTIQQYCGTNHLKINLQRRQWQSVTNFISPTYIWLQRQRAGESHNKCSHVPGPVFFCPSVLPCFVSAETSDSIEFFLL